MLLLKTIFSVFDVFANNDNDNDSKNAIIKVRPAGTFHGARRERERWEEGEGEREREREIERER